MSEFEKAHETIDQALKIIQDLNIMDFALKGKIFARKAAIYSKQKDYENAI